MRIDKEYQSLPAISLHRYRFYHVYFPPKLYGARQNVNGFLPHVDAPYEQVIFYVSELFLVFRSHNVASEEGMFGSRSKHV